MSNSKLPPCFVLAEKSFKKQEKIPLESLDLDLLKHIRALRLEEGEKLCLLNGKGDRAEASWHSKSHIEIKSVLSIAPWLPHWDLYLSAPRGDDFSLALSQATQMGVCELKFLMTQHNQNPQKSEPWKRAERIIQASMEQCGLAWQPKIGSTWMSLEKALDEAKFPVFCDESSAHIHQKIEWIGTGAPKAAKHYSLFIGPEGGWSDSELQILRKRALGICLGPNVLKVPCAIVTAVSFLKTQS